MMKSGGVSPLKRPRLDLPSQAHQQDEEHVEDITEIHEVKIHFILKVFLICSLTLSLSFPLFLSLSLSRLPLSLSLTVLISVYV